MGGTNAKMLEINGETKRLIFWCRQYGICETTYNNRLKKGVTPLEALEGKVPRKKTVYKKKRQQDEELEINGEVKTYKEWCDFYDLNISTPYQRRRAFVEKNKNKYKFSYLRELSLGLFIYPKGQTNPNQIEQSIPEEFIKQDIPQKKESIPEEFCPQTQEESDFCYDFYIRDFLERHYPQYLRNRNNENN